ncbi:MAG: hypothetical protein H7Y38_02095 [Armatimonadetes bacterium]|nr:hypothetical protein [Armatimonadota bacterium]
MTKFAIFYDNYLWDSYTPSTLPSGFPPKPLSPNVYPHTGVTSRSTNTGGGANQAFLDGHVKLDIKL